MSDANANTASQPDTPQLRFKPRYRHVFEGIVARILAGEWKPGDRLPPEPDLCRDYGVSAGTLRRALACLEEEALVERRQGLGTIIKELSPEDSLTRFSRLGQPGHPRVIPHSIVSDSVIRRARGEERRILETPYGNVLDLYRVREFDGSPALLEKITVREDSFPDLVRNAADELYIVYQATYGITIRSVSEVVSAAPIPEAFARRFRSAISVDIAPNRLRIERKALAWPRTVVELRTTYVIDDRYAYITSLS